MQKKYCENNDQTCLSYIADVANKSYLDKCNKSGIKGFISYKNCIDMQKLIKNTQEKYCVGSYTGKDCRNYIDDKDNYSYISLCNDKNDYPQFKSCIKSQKTIKDKQKKYCIDKYNNNDCLNFLSDINNATYFDNCDKDSKNKKNFDTYKNCINMKKIIKTTQSKYCINSDSKGKCLDYINNKDNYSYINTCNNKANYSQFKECVESQKNIKNKQKKYCVDKYNNNDCLNFLSNPIYTSYLNDCNKKSKYTKNFDTYKNCLMEKKLIINAQNKFCTNAKSSSSCKDYMKNDNVIPYINTCNNKSNYGQFKDCIELQQQIKKKQDKYCVGEFNNKDCINFLSNTNNALYFDDCTSSSNSKNYNTYKSCILKKKKIKETQNKYCSNFKQGSSDYKKCRDYINDSKNYNYINSCISNMNYNSFKNCVENTKRQKKKQEEEAKKKAKKQKEEAKKKAKKQEEEAKKKAKKQKKEAKKENKKKKKEKFYGGDNFNYYLLPSSIIKRSSPYNCSWGY